MIYTNTSTPGPIQGQTLTTPFPCTPPLALVNSSSDVFTLTITASDFSGRVGGISFDEIQPEGFILDDGVGGISFEVNSRLNVDVKLWRSLGWQTGWEVGEKGAVGKLFSRTSTKVALGLAAGLLFAVAGW